MKSASLFCLLAIGLPWFGWHNSYAQVKTDQTLRRIETPIFQPISDPNFVYLPMSFNQSEAEARLKNVPVERISSISLVYTQYRMSERFNQMALNDERTAALFRQLPELKAHPEIQWYWIAQTGCADPESCKSLFHGFEIKLKSEDELWTEKSADAMLDYYESLNLGEEPDAKTLDSLASLKGSPVVKNCDTSYIEAYKTVNRYGSLRFNHQNAKKSFIKMYKKIQGRNPESIVILLNAKGNITECQGLTTKEIDLLEASISKNFYVKSSRYMGKSVHTSITITPIINARGRIENFNFSYAPADDNGELLDMSAAPVEYKKRIQCLYTDTSRMAVKTYAYEKVVTEVMDRNPQWKNCLVVTDVTGSMSPYLGQFLAWHKLHLESDAKNRDFVFFNDGNNMPDYLKHSGHVGGIYYVKTLDYNELRKTLALAQRKGSGGDGPENNMEAIIKGIDENPHVSEIILIADNNATPRDIHLLKKISKPIHIVLCGATNGINAAYLNIARDNGGTVHTIEQDLLKLSSYQEGAVFTIEGHTYRIHQNKVDPLRKVTGM